MSLLFPYSCHWKTPRLLLASPSDSCEHFQENNDASDWPLDSLVSAVQEEVY